VPGDVIEAIGGKPVMGSRASKRASTTFAPGDRVRLGILRDGKRVSDETTLVAGR